MFWTMLVLSALVAIAVFNFLTEATLSVGLVGIVAFIEREVLPYAPDAWVDEGATRIGYEISFNRYFYKPQPLRSLEEIRADIEVLERETDGLLGQILVKVSS